MDIRIFCKLLRHSQSLRICSHKRQRRLRRFLHHFAQLSSQQQPFLAGHHNHFNGQNVSAEAGPRQPHCNADLRFEQHAAAAKRRCFQQAVHILLANRNASAANFFLCNRMPVFFFWLLPVGLRFQLQFLLLLGNLVHDLLCQFSQDRCQLPFQIPNPCFFGVLLNNRHNRCIVKSNPVPL